MAESPQQNINEDYARRFMPPERRQQLAEKDSPADPVDTVAAPEPPVVQVEEPAPVPTVAEAVADAPSRPILPTAPRYHRQAFLRPLPPRSPLPHRFGWRSP